MIATVVRAVGGRLSLWLAVSHGVSGAEALPEEHVVVEVDSSVPDAEQTGSWVENRAQVSLKRLLTPLDAGDEVRISVAGTPYDYQVSVVLVHRGVELPADEQPRVLMCSCGSNELLVEIGQMVRDGGQVIVEAARRERAEAERAAVEEARARAEAQRMLEQEAARAEQARLENERYAPTGLGWAGIGVLGVGGAVIASGSIMAAIDVSRVEGPGYVERRWTGAGRVLIGIGVTAAVGGATALIVDVVRCRRWKGSCRRRETAARGRSGHLLRRHDSRAISQSNRRAILSPSVSTHRPSGGR